MPRIFLSNSPSPMSVFYAQCDLDFRCYRVLSANFNSAFPRLQTPSRFKQPWSHAAASAFFLLCSSLLQGCSLGPRPSTCARERWLHGSIIAGMEGEPSVINCDNGFQPSELATRLRCVELMTVCPDGQHGKCFKQYGFQAMDSGWEDRKHDSQRGGSSDSAGDFKNTINPDDMNNQMIGGMMGGARRLANVSTGDSKPSLPTTRPRKGACEPVPDGMDCPAQQVSRGRILPAKLGDAGHVDCIQGSAVNLKLTKFVCTSSGFQLVPPQSAANGTAAPNAESQVVTKAAGDQKRSGNKSRLLGSHARHSRKRRRGTNVLRRGLCTPGILTPIRAYDRDMWHSDLTKDSFGTTKVTGALALFGLGITAYAMFALSSLQHARWAPLAQADSDGTIHDSVLEMAEFEGDVPLE